jgi:ribokinase
MSRVVVVGSYNVGLTVISPRLPTPGETVLGHTFDLGPGGKGSNQAIGARRLGADTTLVAKVGNDGFGQDARELFAAEGLVGPGILEANTHTGVGLVLVDDDAENMISVAPGANAELHGDDLDGINDLFAGSGYLLCQLEAPVDLYVEAATRARSAGFKTILNPAPAAELPDAALALTDIITPNEHELALLLGGDGEVDRSLEPAAHELLDRGVGEVIITMGAAGVARFSSNETMNYPAKRVKPIDPTGAGDAFNAGLAAGRAGAFCVTRVGVVPGLPTRQQLDTEVPE